MVNLIKKKRDGHSLSREELTEIVEGLVSGKTPDYQIAAFLMAVYFKGMDAKETAVLTELMMHSGDVIDLSAIDGIKVDKHSTGGVGDKTSLILAPLVAAAGVPVAKMSGRGLGHTGGTLDKLESIEGLKVEMSSAEFIKQIQNTNIAICGQNANLVPADKKLYAMRDVTATVSEFSLISASIMSKKLACGADAIVLDIKVGDGAYMKTVDDAMRLGKMMREIGANLNRKVICVITSMDQPLGYAVGNGLEIQEVIQCLQGNGPEDLMELCYNLGAHMLVLGEKSTDFDEAKDKLKELINNGSAFSKFKEMISAQGGNIEQIENPSLLPQASKCIEVIAEESGYVADLKAFDIGMASMKLGAGRETKASVIDMAAGIYLYKKIGDSVSKGDVLAKMYTNDESNIELSKSKIINAYSFTKDKIEPNSIIRKTII